MDKEQTIHDVIKERMSLPEEIKSKIKLNIFFNIIMAIIMIACTLIINIVYSKTSTASFEKYIHIFQMVLAIITVIFFETAYKKDSFLISFYGIEMFVFSVGVMFVPYFYILKGKLNTLVILIVLFTVYYIFKSIFTLINIRNNYIKNNISDVKEIVQDHKKGYLDEESNKTLKEKKKKQESKEKVVNKKITSKVSEPKVQDKKNEKKKDENKSVNTKTVSKKEKYTNDNLDEKIEKLKKLQKGNKLFDKKDEK